MMRAVLWGGGLAVVAVAVVVALVVSGVVDLGAASEPPQKLLIIGTAPDEEGAEVAAFAFVLERGSDSALVLDTMQAATVPNTSAGNAREAYPFVGGEGVSEALAAQTGGEALPWVVLPADVWGKLVDDAGGIEVDVPQDVSVYRDGSLVVLDQGVQRLSGAQAAALLRAVGFIEKPDVRAQVSGQITAAVSAVVSAQRQGLSELIAAPDSTTSLTTRQLAEFSGGKQ